MIYDKEYILWKRPLGHRKCSEWDYVNVSMITLSNGTVTLDSDIRQGLSG